MARHPCLIGLGMTFILSACASLLSSPSSALPEMRPVVAAADSTKTLTVKEGMVFYDSDLTPTRAMWFPPGTYALEAEDDAYRYMRAPSPVEMRVLDGIHVRSTKSAPGGIMIAKTKLRTRANPAAGYIDAEIGEKRIVWPMGAEFLHWQWIQWQKSF
jgi:hypothetical protein